MLLTMKTWEFGTTTRIFLPFAFHIALVDVVAVVAFLGVVFVAVVVEPAAAAAAVVVVVVDDDDVATFGGGGAKNSGSSCDIVGCVTF